MSRLEVAYRVLLAIADDYESTDHVYESVVKDAPEVVSREEVFVALETLLADRLVDGFTYNDQDGTFRSNDTKEVSQGSWYYISEGGKSFLSLTRLGL